MDGGKADDDYIHTPACFYRRVEIRTDRRQASQLVSRKDVASSQQASRLAPSPPDSGGYHGVLWQCA